MSVAPPKTFNLPWHQPEQYWIGIYPKREGFSATLMEALMKQGFHKNADSGMGMQTPAEWKPCWDKAYAALSAAKALEGVDVVVMAGAAAPASDMVDRKTPSAIQAIAESLWLGEALLENRVICYLQPVFSVHDKIIGYESFARVRAHDGTVIAGDKIVAASKALGMEYMIDRHLHVQAIKTFVSSEFHGYLFVNFFPGFIHRPAVYLEGLTETARQYGVFSKNIVLEFTKSEKQRDLTHLKNVCDYGRSQGYSIALDDVHSLDTARKLVAEIRPDFVKIDMRLARHADQPQQANTIRELVELVHKAGGLAIGEGVETEAVHQALRALGVDLFQGYLFSPPMPVEAALKRA